MTTPTELFGLPATRSTPSAIKRPRKSTAARIANTHVDSGVDYDSDARLLVFREGAEDPRVAAARMMLHGAASEDARVAMEAIRAELPPATAKKMSDYKSSLPAAAVEAIRPFVENAVALALPKTTHSVETLLGPCMHFVYWAVYVIGADLDADIIFKRELIENYVREAAKDRSEGTRRNHRAWLFRVAEAANPEANPRNPMPLNARAVETPYDADGFVALGRWAAGQKTPHMRTAAKTLLALGAGAGLRASEIAVLRREAITVDEKGRVTIEITEGGPHRVVPVTAQFEKSLAKAAKVMPPGSFAFLPNRVRTGHEVVSAFVSRSSMPPGSPVVRASKLRNTWLIRQMTNRVDVLTLMDAAGLQSLESISRLASYVPRPSEKDRLAQLRGTR